MNDFLIQILTNEYIFTFLVTFFSVFFKAYTSRQNSFFRNRQTYELGLEFMFIAISFAASNLALITQNLQSKNADQVILKESIEKHSIEGLQLNEANIEALQIQIVQLQTEVVSLQSAFDAMNIVALCIFVAIVLTIILLRKYGYTDNHPNKIQGLIVPNFLGIVSVILVLTLIYQP